MTDENKALARTLARRRPTIGRLSLGLDRPRTPAQALDEALYGKWVAGWYVLGYGCAEALIASVAIRLMSPAALIVFAFGLGFVVLGVALGLVISSRQARWASLLLLVWTAYECFKTGSDTFLRGNVNLAFLANVVCLFYALRSVRGSFALVQMRRANNEVIESFG
jgi:hypothetical protein